MKVASYSVLLALFCAVRLGGDCSFCSIKTMESGSPIIVKQPIESLSDLLKAVEYYKNWRIFVLYFGTPQSDGQSWCPDCREAKPTIDEALKYLPYNGVFLTVYVGDRATWKDPQNEFRTYPKCSVQSIPTIDQWEPHNRVSGDNILHIINIQNLFADK
ncbi:unnamed protein product [Calicophoron daubneyi]|uniref:Thioredoxin domain-containing protein 17 n=1 Tax=Calicophoron daubneyi TaxID=300641 RepID=A0AAV2TDT8_CALDB